jgi:hypothetical protein
MDEHMTKAKLLDTLRERRAAWDDLLARIPAERMTEPGVAGEWSGKDVVAHLTYHERWYASRLHEQLRGETYVPAELDRLPFDERNERIYQQQRDRPLAELLTESRQAFQDLLAGVAAHTEEFLITPQHFEGAPGPVIIWQMLRGDVYEHYGQHLPSLASLAQ